MGANVYLSELCREWMRGVMSRMMATCQCRVGTGGYGRITGARIMTKKTDVYAAGDTGVQRYGEEGYTVVLVDVCPPRASGA